MLTMTLIVILITIFSRIASNMARVICLLTVNVKIYLNLYFSTTLASSQDKFAPQFDNLKVVNLTRNEDYTTVLFEVRGKNIFKGLQIKATTNRAERDTLCVVDLNYSVSEVSVDNHDFATARYELSMPREVYGDFYLCLPHNNKGYDVRIPPNILKGVPDYWYHQGPNVKVTVPHDEHIKFKGSVSRVRRGQTEDNKLKILGIRLEVSYKDVEFDEHGVPEVLANVEHTIRIFGSGFFKAMTVTFTSEKGKYNTLCNFPATKGFRVLPEGFTPQTARVKIKLPAFKEDADTYYICVNSNGSFKHQGSEYWLQIRTIENLLPIWAMIVLIAVCLMFSFLFSGLNLGLMSLDRTELKILCNTGTAKAKKYAKVIQPVRNHGNYLLCSILIGNVFVNSFLTILLDTLTSGWIAVIFSTITIVLFGEITPQAICYRHGLWVGANTIYITKSIMVLTFPLSYPVSKLLDCVLGEEIGNVYNRERLKELVKVTTGQNDLDKDEVNIISGALELSRKTVADVMTRIEDVFMLDYEAILDFETVSEIMKSGYSRVPVFEGNRQNIVTMLYIKDLAFVDPDDNTPLKTLCQFYQYPCNFVLEDVTLDVMFRIFKDGNKGHMALVHRINNEGDKEPFYETTGVVTLEDVIEELIQAEIMDETDVFTDNRTKRRRNADRRQDFSVFAERRGEANRLRISPQLTLATYQFLSTSVDNFLPTVISETILKRLLKQDIICHIRKSKEWRTDPANIIYQQGQNCDYFVLILEGRVEVTIGRENLTFEGGPFTYFGTQALIQTVDSPSVSNYALGSLESLKKFEATSRYTFQPDYTVRAPTDVIYLRVKRSLYLAAKRATLMERSQQNNEQFVEEVDKQLLHSLNDDDADSGGGRNPS